MSSFQDETRSWWGNVPPLATLAAGGWQGKSLRQSSPLQGLGQEGKGGGAASSSQDRLRMGWKCYLLVTLAAGSCRRQSPNLRMSFHSLELKDVCSSADLLPAAPPSKQPKARENHWLHLAVSPFPFPSSPYPCPRNLPFSNIFQSLAILG